MAEVIEASAHQSDIKKTTEIADNINKLKQNMVNNLFQIGRLLSEAKESISHGEWKNWLEERVQFSQETARKFMRIYTEFDSQNENIQKLGTEKLYMLLSIPQKDRQEFIEDTHYYLDDNEDEDTGYINKTVQEMSTRELKMVIKDYKDDSKSSKFNKIPFNEQKLNLMKKQVKNVLLSLDEMQNAYKYETMWVKNSKEEFDILKEYQSVKNGKVHCYYSYCQFDIEQRLESLIEQSKELSGILNNLEPDTDNLKTIQEISPNEEIAKIQVALEYDQAKLEPLQDETTITKIETTIKKENIDSVLLIPSQDNIQTETEENIALGSPEELEQLFEDNPGITLSKIFLSQGNIAKYNFCRKLEQSISVCDDKDNLRISQDNYEMFILKYNGKNEEILRKEVNNFINKPK